MPPPPALDDAAPRRRNDVDHAVVLVRCERAGAGRAFPLAGKQAVG